MEHAALRTKLSRRRVDGVVLLDKPAGPSSNHALQAVKRALRAEKAGHTGTLDPFATGLLPLMFGEATKFSSFLLDSYKVYQATILLGTRTNTSDITGEIIERRAVEAGTDAIEKAVASFVGESMQVPPMYSALKRDGVPLYALARRGEVVEREARRVEIVDFSVVGIRDARVDVRLKCSKGTYVRVLAEDIGRLLGCGATLESLRRIEVASFHVDAAVPLEAIASGCPEELDRLLLPIDAGLHHLPKLSLEATTVARLQLGQRVAYRGPAVSGDPLARAYSLESMNFVGLVSVLDGIVRPMKMVVPVSTKMA